MSILITGTEMPTSCRACMFSRTDIRNVDWCVLTEKDLPCDCPIIPVPEHGRLIDASVLMENCMKEDTFLAEMLFRKLSNAPTIIPADKEGEG